MFVWIQGSRQLTAAMRPPGYEYRHQHHKGHVCRAPTLEVRDRVKVLLLLPLQALEEVDETHALAELFEDLDPWMRFCIWLWGLGYEPLRRPHGATGAHPVLSPKDEKILRGQGLKFENRGLVDIDYRHRLDQGAQAWLARALEHIVENRWRYDGHDLVEPGSPLARQIYADYEARRRCYLLLPDQEAPRSENG